MSQAERGEPFPLDKIIPNRFNPNEMDWTQRLRLQKTLKNDEYDPIIISPVNVFYGPEVIEDITFETEDGVEIYVKAFGPDKYVICDGEQRWKEAKRLGLGTIRALVWHMNENDSMPYFYKRQSLHGEFDPLKEAKMFLHERDVNGLKMDEIAKKYNLPSRYYIRDRLRLTKVSSKVLELFWEPPDDAEGKLTITHLKEIARLESQKWQRAVALMALYRKWSYREVEKEVRRINAGRGLLDLNEYKELIKKGPPPDKTIPSEKVPETKLDEPIPEEKLFEEYPEDFLKEPEPEIKPEIKPKKVHDVPTRVISPLFDEEAEKQYEGPEVHPVPDFWDKPRPRKIVVPKPVIPPLIINRDLIDQVMDHIYELGIREGRDLRKNGVDKLLEDELDNNLNYYYHFKRERNDELKIESLKKFCLRAVQLLVLFLKEE